MRLAEPFVLVMSDSPMGDLASGGLHAWLLIACVAILAMAFGAMLYSTLSHRRSAQRKSAPFHKSLAAELAWMIVPIAIVITMLVRATK